MATVKLEVFGWVAAACGYNQGSKILSNETMEERTTVGELLLLVAEKDHCFRNAVFTSGMSLQSGISVVLNGKILGQPTFLDSRVEDGDTVMLLPAIDGG